MYATCCRLLLLGLFALGTLSTGNAQESFHPKHLLIYLGTSGAKSEGIYTTTLELATGELTPPKLAAKASNPNFLAFHPNGNYLYAVGDIDGADGKKVGGVSCYKVNVHTSDLTLVNQQPSEGRGPCHVSVDRHGKVVMLANYGSGSCASYRIGKDDKLMPAASAHQHIGKSVDPARQDGPHAHSINVDPNNKFAFVCDLGLDQILLYKLDAESGKLTPNDPPFVKTPAGGGPRHFAFHPSGKWAFANNEMTSSVTVYAYDAAKGTLTEGQTISTLPSEVKGNSTAETQVHPNGKFVYVSNRGHDSIATFDFDASTGKLAPKGHQPTGGKTPRNFIVESFGKYLIAANQGSGTVVVFKIDENTGLLTSTGQKIEVPAPVCVKYLPIL